eukprot:gene7274-9705_t
MRSKQKPRGVQKVLERYRNAQQQQKEKLKQKQDIKKRESSEASHDEKQNKRAKKQQHLRSSVRRSDDDDVDNDIYCLEGDGDRDSDNDSGHLINDEHIAGEGNSNDADDSEYENDDSDDDDDDDSSEDELQLDADDDAEMMQCDIRACTPDKNDFWGIKQLIQQLLRDDSINYSDVADSLIENNECTTVIKSSDDEDHALTTSQTKDDDQRYDVFGVAGMVSLHGEKAQPHIRTWLLRRCKEVDTLMSLLEQPSTAFIICERIVNLPPQLGTAMYETLLKDILSLPQAFSELMHLSPGKAKATQTRYHHLQGIPEKKTKKMQDKSSFEFYGPEDSLFFKTSLASCQTTVPKTPAQLQDKTQPDKIFRIICAIPFESFRNAVSQLAIDFHAEYEG